VPTVEADAYELFERGKSLLADRHAHQAATVLERAQALAPDRGSVCEALGRAYYASGRFDQAKAQFAKAVELDPANDYGHFGLGLCLLKTGERDLALGHLRLAVVMRPDSEAYRSAMRRAGAGTRDGRPPPDQRPPDQRPPDQGSPDQRSSGQGRPDQGPDGQGPQGSAGRGPVELG
jgi:tetratricopeptide (TPR) repeat protein